MDAGALTARLNQIAPGLVLEKARFGRSETLSVWVEARSLPKFAEAVCGDSELQLDWLENLTVAQLDEALVLTYFLRSRTTHHRLVIRASVVPPGPSKAAEVPSVDGVWPLAWPFEREGAELFGIDFAGRSLEESRGFASSVDRGWTGYPLRKSFNFPSEIFGIAHSRPPTRRGSPK